MRFKSSFTIPAVAAISFWLISGAVPAAADILHVPGDFATIQAAIDAAMDGDEVEVHPGTYFETINFLGKAIRVYSTDGPDVTIIDAQQTGRVVTCDNSEGPDTVLDGFTVTGGDPGGMRNSGSSPTVTNCTFSGNSGGNVGAGMYNFFSSPTVSNCVLWGDSLNEILNEFSTPTVTYSNVQGGYTGTGNIDADPLFVAPGSGDLRLSPGSPCIDAADNTAVPKGIETDLVGNPRFVDDPDTDDTGFGDPPIVDMGAYEFQVMNCPWDVNGDGVVNHHDILEVVHNLGQCDDPDNCPWDVNGDGIVNGRDVAAVARHFGSCP